MPGLFDITPPSTFVPLKRQWQGTAAFTVRLLAKHAVKVTARVVTIPPDSRAAQWLTLRSPKGETSEPDNLREFKPKESKDYLVGVELPSDAELGVYDFKLVVADAVHPEGSLAESEVVTFAILEPRKLRWQTCLIIAIVVAVLLVIGFIAFSMLVVATDTVTLPACM